MISAPDAQTLLAVVIGAVLATAGGFSERQFERLVRQRERERNAAMLFGELMNAIRLILQLANEARGRGDPYGPITQRFVRSALREAEIYNRNREVLFDIKSARIRAEISVLMARLFFALEGTLDACAALADLEIAGVANEERLAALRQTRDTSFDFALQAVQRIPPILESLAPLAQHSFDAADSIVREI